ncbi:MAG TPA: VOC family protein [Gammaproteobacteria bacterium]|nr:VOC family protein [Gammaproteobacteria bacterium]
MNITGLDHYNLRVPQGLLDSVCRFYADVLKLVPGPRPPFRSSGRWLYAADQPLLHLTGFEPDETPQAGTPGTGWFNHVAFRCEDLAAAEARLKAHGVAYQRDEVPLLGQVQLFLTDPAGIGVELNFITAD